MKVVIVGGVAGGASAAARLRRLDEDAKIIIFERSHYVSYANCGLPYYLGGIIKDESDLLLETAESLYERFRIDVRVDSEVISVDIANKTVIVKHAGHEYKESYDHLILAPGSTYRKLYANEDKLAHLKNVEDVRYLKEALVKAQKIAIIGGGFIGIETAENLRHIGKEVAIFEYADHILANLDPDMAMYLEDEIRKNDIELHLQARIKEISDDQNITLEDGTVYDYDLVIVAAGVRANTDFLKDSGIELDERGNIITDEYMMTSAIDVWACGDATVSPHFISGKLENVALAGPANKQGRLIADNICGLKRAYDGSIGTSIIKVFDLAGASTGYNTARLRRDGYAFGTICTHPNSHASYYPGAKALHIKLFYDEDHLILGAQVVSKEGADKFIDVIATAIKAKMRVEDLSDLELAYAPPFLSAKSPANYLGFIASNVFNDLEELILENELSKGAIILDVRTKEEYDRGHLDNSINIPVDELRERLDELEMYKDNIIDVYCAVGIRAHIASRILIAKGYETRNITGGYSSHRAYS